MSDSTSQPPPASTATYDSESLLKELSSYQHPTRLQSIWQLLNTLVPYAALWYLGYLALQYSFWLVLPIVVLMAGFLVRIFIIFHDCGHGSFFQSRKANDFWGILTGIMTYTPYYQWRASHARHHATSGNLDKRGNGDVWLMTVEEFHNAPRKVRIKYRLYRNPFVMLLLGPLTIFLLDNRLPRRKGKRKERFSVHLTNAVMVLLTVGLIYILGWQTYLYIHVFSLLLAHIAGVWLFYVQHQFEGVYWQRNAKWDFVTASLEGGSFYRLPAILRWFSGNIGYHHLHHLNSRIPNYNLVKCQRNVSELQKVYSFGVLDSLKSLKFRLWDEQRGKLISFGELRRQRVTS